MLSAIRTAVRTTANAFQPRTERAGKLWGGGALPTAVDAGMGGHGAGRDRIRGGMHTPRGRGGREIKKKEPAITAGKPDDVKKPEKGTKRTTARQLGNYSKQVHQNAVRWAIAHHGTTGGLPPPHALLVFPPIVSVVS